MRTISHSNLLAAVEQALVDETGHGLRYNSVGHKRVFCAAVHEITPVVGIKGLQIRKSIAEYAGVGTQTVNGWCRYLHQHFNTVAVAKIAKAAKSVIDATESERVELGKAELAAEITALQAALQDKLDQYRFLTGSTNALARMVVTSSMNY